MRRIAFIVIATALTAFPGCTVPQQRLDVGVQSDIGKNEKATVHVAYSLNIN